MNMHKTRNDLPDSVRLKVCEILNARLADAIDFYSHAKQAHWNVRGANFIALHELFDKLAGFVHEGIDEIAERLVALGGTAEGTIRMAAKKSTLPEYPVSLIQANDHVTVLSNHLGSFGKNLRRAIEETAELKDADTSDLFTGLSREADKYLWMLEAHLT